MKGSAIITRHQAQFPVAHTPEEVRQLALDSEDGFVMLTGIKDIGDGRPQKGDEILVRADEIALAQPVTFAQPSGLVVPQPEIVTAR